MALPPEDQQVFGAGRARGCGRALRLAGHGGDLALAILTRREYDCGAFRGGVEVRRDAAGPAGGGRVGVGCRSGVGGESRADVVSAGGNGAVGQHKADAAEEGAAGRHRALAVAPTPYQTSLNVLSGGNGERRVPGALGIEVVALVAALMVLPCMEEGGLAGGVRRANVDPALIYVSEQSPSKYLYRQTGERQQLSELAGIVVCQCWQRRERQA